MLTPAMTSNSRDFAPVDDMKVTIVGSGDAFGSGGRAHTCIRIDAAATTVLVDFGSGSMIAWQKLGFDSNDIDAIVVSHLHGDHFGGIPALLLHAQFVAGRRKPLLLVGPFGLKERLQEVLRSAFSPAARRSRGISPGACRRSPAAATAPWRGLTLETFDVIHSPGSHADGHPAFGRQARLCLFRRHGLDGNLERSSRPTPISSSVECSSGDEPVPNHLHWPELKGKLKGFTAKRIAVTHMGPSAIAKIPEMQAAGLIVAKDGLSLNL